MYIYITVLCYITQQLVLATFMIRQKTKGKKWKKKANSCMSTYCIIKINVILFLLAS